MVDRRLSLRLENGESRWESRRLFDGAVIERFLSTDRVFASYPLGDLDEPNASMTSWYGAFYQEELISLAMVYAGLQPPILFLMGDPGGLGLLLGSLVRERQVYANCRPEHQALLEAYYAPGQVQAMYRMFVRRESFTPQRRHAPERLTPARAGEVQRLFDQSGWRIVAFSPAQLARGCYYGIREGGDLVSIAGTHVVSPAYRVAAVGNVFTLPEARGKGYASACTSRVTEDLLAQGALTVLNVNQHNAVAIGVYRRLGYEIHCPFVELPAARRGPR